MRQVQWQAPVRVASAVLTVLAVVCLAAPIPALAAEPAWRPDDNTLSSAPSARHAVYLELNSALFSASVGLNYAFRFSRGFLVSGGLGTSGLAAGGVGFAGVGSQVLAHWLFGAPSPHAFEAALGAAVLVGTPTLVMPATFLGYRYHPLDGGFLFRAGAGWSYVFGFGLSLSGGVAF